MIQKNNILQFENLSQFDSLIHGFSTRAFGSLKPSDPDYKASLQKFCEVMGITTDQLVRLDQVHGKNVYVTSMKDGGKLIEKTDGIITRDQNVFLGVITADCIPLLFYDPKKEIVAAVHAGWRGIFAEIIKEVVEKMKTLGSDPSDIIVGIGPCNRSCCYDIAKDHKEKLLAKFPDWEPFILTRDGKFFLDLPGISVSQLQAQGVLLENIEDADSCTFESKDLYSYRREGKDFGEIMGIIGRR